MVERDRWRRRGEEDCVHVHVLVICPVLVCIYMYVCLYVCMYVCMYVRERASWGNDSSRATDGGMLALIVDPVVPYARSRFRQRQDFHLRPPSDTGIGGSLALIDWYHFPTHPSTPRHVAERKFDQVPRS